MIKSFLPSVLRTVVPLIVTVVAGWPITQALGVDNGQLEIAASAVVGGLYWLAVRALETYAPRAGWLLGYPGAPGYLALHAADRGMVITAGVPKVKQ